MVWNVTRWLQFQNVRMTLDSEFRWIRCSQFLIDVLIFSIRRIELYLATFGGINFFYGYLIRMISRCFRISVDVIGSLLKVRKTQWRQRFKLGNEYKVSRVALYLCYGYWPPQNYVLTIQSTLTLPNVTTNSDFVLQENVYTILVLKEGHNLFLMEVKG